MEMCMDPGPARSCALPAMGAGRQCSMCCMRAGLTRVCSPWLLAPVAWDGYLTKRAVIWLALLTGKAVSRLTDSDYSEHHLQVRRLHAHVQPNISVVLVSEMHGVDLGFRMRDILFIPLCPACLLRGGSYFQGQSSELSWKCCCARQALLEQAGPAQALNERVFAELQATVTGSPGCFTGSSERVQVHPRLCAGAPRACLTAAQLREPLSCCTHTQARRLSPLRRRRIRVADVRQGACACRCIALPPAAAVWRMPVPTRTALQQRRGAGRMMWGSGARWSSRRTRMMTSSRWAGPSPGCASKGWRWGFASLRVMHLCDG